MRRLSLLVSLLVTCGFVLSAHAEQPTATKSGNWSAKSTWADGKVPAQGDIVSIASGANVVLDVSPPALNGMTINGKLSFADKADLALSTEWIMVHGELAIGTEAKPFKHNATITLTDNVKGEQLMGMGDRGIMLSGGTLNLHGNRTNTWSKLAKTADAGATSIEVLNASQWKAGDEIVLASTDYDPRQAERRTISAVKGNAITLDKPLEYMHFGKITFNVDERGEVGLLTRNIKVQASEDAEQTSFGGHIMAMVTSKMYVEGVELNRMGQNMELARYPIHWHLVGDAGKGQYIKNAAIHDTYNRCVTIHGTNDVRVENNVTYNIVGHCFFLEDGIEHGNEFVHNLAIQIKCHMTEPCVPTNLASNGENGYEYENRMAIRAISFAAKKTLLPSDNTVAAYWITNPDNTFVDNVAAGSDENGFWLSLPEHPQGAFMDSDASKATWPRRTHLREFKNNTAHSNFDGFMFDRNINKDNTFGLAGNAYAPKENPADPKSKSLETHFDNLVTYKNRNGGFWGRGELFVVTNLKTADNAIGYTMSSGDFGREAFTSRVEDSLFVGETDNIGNPVTPEEKAYGRSLPKRKVPDFPIHGYQYYDYRVDVVNSTFVNYQDNKQRESGALSWLLFTSSGVTTENTVKGAKFVNAKPVHFPKYDKRFDNDNRGGIAFRTLAIHDLDGSATGIPNSYVLLNDGENDSVATDSTCKIQPTWNASVCTGDVGRLYLRGAAPAAGPGIGAPRAANAAPGAGAAASVLGATAPAVPVAAAPAARPAPQPELPVVLSRNGKEFHIGNQSTVRAGTEILVKTERPEVSFSLSEMNKDSWVIFELPGFAKATSGTELSSIDALRKASETAYFKDKDALWVKLIVPADPEPPVRPTLMQTSITVTR
ncbi:MAG TPA: G8 domain-containing protein [Candidatus Acidoferrum sp.]|nr:G8 domain-containing protein [Candidatus Acidoferrum sp.]